MKKTEKRILFFIPRMGNGGAERVMATLANELSKIDYEVLIVSLTTDESFYKLNDNVDIIGANYDISKSNKIKRNYDMISNGIKSLFYLNEQIKRWQPDVVVSFLTHTNVISALVKILNPKLNLIVSERAEPRLRNLGTKIVTKYSYTIADKIVCQSQKVSTFFPDYAQDKIRVIENPINEDALTNKLVETRKKRIVAVGRLFAQKNFSLLINSFSDIASDFPIHTLEIYGEGPLRNSLQTQIDQLGLTDRILLMGVKKDVMKYIADSELFVMSSDFEGFPNALVEAMATGLPVISTDFSTGVARDLVKEENGIVVPVGDQVTLTTAMHKILSNKNLIDSMGEANKLIRNKLSIDKVLSKWVSIFD